MTNCEEFIFESKPTMMIVSTPEVPQQCGNENGVEWSKLSKTQKKKSKAKAKIQNVKQLLNDCDQTSTLKITLQQNDKIDTKELDQHDFTFASMLIQKPTINISPEDSLISAIQEVIDKVLGHIKINDDDVVSVLKVVNDRGMED